MKISNILFLSISCLFFLFSCKSDTPKSEKVATAESKKMLQPPQPIKDGIHYGWLKNANVYEINTRQYTEEGNFNGILKHLPRLRKMGIDIIWLMPIHPISQTKRKGSLGSPYAITDYKQVNPEFGTKQDFKTLVDSIHSLRMKVILDFVPNHTGWDSQWIKDHPEWYTQDKNGNIIDPIDPGTGESWGWTDVADLNYDNQDMRNEMISCMEYWVDQFKIDGYRVDVAHNVPNDFWAQASAKLLSKQRDVFLLAESETPEHTNNNYFHATYGWSFHHLLNDIAKGEKQAKDIVDWYKEDRKKFTKGWHLNFTSNHDENSWNGTVFERYGPADKCMTALAFTFDGMPLIYGGQEEPLRKRLKFFEKDPITFGEYDYEEFYTRMLQVKHMNTALWNGDYGAEPNILQADEQILAFEKNNKGNEVFCLFNLSNEAAEYEMHKDYIQWESVAVGRRFDVVKGQKINLAPWSFRVVTNR